MSRPVGVGVTHQSPNGTLSSRGTGWRCRVLGASGGVAGGLASQQTRSVRWSHRSVDGPRIDLASGKPEAGR